MTDTEQTYLKQRFEEGRREESNYGNQSIVRSEFVDIRCRNSHAVGGSGSRLDVAIEPEGSWRSEVTSVEQLRKRIRELETTVLLQNLDIRNGESLQRNYEAALRKIQTRETENGLLSDDRDLYYHESRFYREQAHEKTKQCEKKEERVRHLNASLIEKDRKIRDLERQLMLNSRPDTENQLSSNGLLSFKKPEGSPPESGNGTDQGGSQAKRRRRDFRKSLTSLPKCINCQTVFDVLQPHSVDCSFHRSLPQPLKVWKSQLDVNGEKFGSLDLSSYRFWPCCEKHGVKEPPGCLTLKSHEIVFPDEE